MGEIAWRKSDINAHAELRRAPPTLPPTPHRGPHAVKGGAADGRCRVDAGLLAAHRGARGERGGPGKRKKLTKRRLLYSPQVVAQRTGELAVRLRHAFCAERKRARVGRASSSHLSLSIIFTPSMLQAVPCHASAASPSAERCDVVVIGGGISGLHAALQLQEQGRIYLQQPHTRLFTIL